MPKMNSHTKKIFDEMNNIRKTPEKSSECKNDSKNTLLKTVNTKTLRKLPLETAQHETGSQMRQETQVLQEVSNIAWDKNNIVETWLADNEKEGKNMSRVLTPLENVHPYSPTGEAKNTTNTYSIVEKNCTNENFPVSDTTYQHINQKDLKNLQENWGYNYSENETRESVIWNKIKILKFFKEEPFSIFYKTSYTEDNFKTINLRNKRKKNMLDIMSINLKEAYSCRLKLNDNKKRGLRELISRNLIPNFYADFYKDIIN